MQHREENYLVPLKRFGGLLNAERKNIYPIFFYAILNGLILLALPLGIQAILNFVLGGRLSTSWVLLVILVTGALAFSGFLQVSQLYLVEKLQQRVFAKSAFEFAYRIPRMKLSKLVGKYPPELINRFFDTINIQKGLSKLLVDMTTALLQIFFGLVLLSIYHPFFVVLSIILIFFVYLLFRFTSPKGMQTSLRESTSKYEVAFWLEEMARTLGTFKLAGKTDLPESKVDKLIDNYVVNRQAHFKVLIRQYIIMIGFKVLIVGSLLVTGSILLINNEISVGQFVAAEVIIILVLGSIEKLILTLETVYDTLTATEKVGKVMDIELEEFGKINPVSEHTHTFSIEFKNVTFKYPKTGRAVLNKISFTIPAGQKVVITGSVSSGKSTLLHLIGGLYDNYEGEIYINGIHLHLIDIKQLRTYIGDSMSQQNIFRGTIRENITLGRPDESGTALQKSVEVAGLREYVKQLRNEYDEMLLPQGMMIPNDIVRKIILARSFYHKPGLMLLEAPVAQITEQEKRLMLDHIFAQDYTMLAVSGDKDLLSRADRILELDNGNIVFDGDFQTFQSR